MAYKVVAFGAGFVLMAFELVAARLLAPTIGSSTFIWTNVIGVIMAAMAFGYWAGGKLADGRREVLDIAWLLLLTAVSICFVLLCHGGIIDFAVGMSKDARWQGLFAAGLLFAVPSLLLGMVSPYLAKFAVVNTKSTGRSVAGLSTMNALGSIVGTFVTGFVLFGVMGGNATLFVTIVLAVGISWLLVPRKAWQARAAASVAIVVLSGLVVFKPADPNLITVDTESARYVISRMPWGDKDVTALSTGPGGIQSAVWVEGEKDLVFWYTQKMVGIVEKVFDGTGNILIIGGGAFTMPEYLARKFPNAQVDVVEIDPQLAGIAEKYFRFEQPDNLAVYAEDARSFVRDSNKKYDVILIDAFSDAFVPWQLVTREFGSRIAGILTEDGVVAINTILAPEGKCKGLFEAFYGIYATHLPHRYMIRRAYSRTDYGNLEMVFSRRDLGGLGLEMEVIEKESWKDYGDEFAPIEHLSLKCS